MRPDGSGKSTSSKCTVRNCFVGKQNSARLEADTCPNVDSAILRVVDSSVHLISKFAVAVTKSRTVTRGESWRTRRKNQPLPPALGRTRRGLKNFPLRERRKPKNGAEVFGEAKRDAPTKS